MVGVVLGNIGAALLCALTGQAATALPLLAQAPAVGLAPAAAVALAAMLLGGWRVLPGVLAGMFAAALALRPEAAPLAAALAGTTAAAALWTSVYTRFVVDDVLPDLVRTLRGVGTLLALTVGCFAIWHATLASLAEIIVGGAGRDHAAFESALLTWSGATAVSAVVVVPPAVLLAAWHGLPPPWRVARRLAVWAGIVLASGLLFGAGGDHGSLAEVLPFLLLPLLMAAAACSASVTAVAVALAGLTAFAVTLGGAGAPAAPESILDAAPTAVVVAAMAVAALPFGALMHERRVVVAELRATNKDLEERVAARTVEARAGEARLRSILESSSVAVCVARPEGSIVFANAAFRALFGVCPADIEHLDVGSLFEDPSDRQRLLDRLTREGPAVDIELRYRYADRTGWALEHAVLTEFEGAPAVVAWMVDITARKQAEAALEETRARLAAHRDALAEQVAERTADLERARDAAEAASRAKSEFLAAMSHELRTPLNAIIGFAQIIESDLIGPEARDSYRDYAGSIHRSGTHLLGVIDDILDTARIDSGRLALAEERVEILPCVERAVALTTPAPEAAAPRVVLDLPVRLPAVRGDRRRMEQMLVKLLSNAVRFTPPPGTVTVSVRRVRDGGLALVIRDSGIGMQPDQIGRALLPFQQIDSGLGRRYEGTGLGLPLARGLAEMHGATLSLSSRPGDGTEVVVAFPPDRVLEPQAVRHDAARQAERA